MLSWLNKISIRNFVLAASAIILATLILGNLWRSQLSAELALIPQQLNILAQTETALQELRYHTTQIQQFMTDASLTGDAEAVTLANQHAQAAKDLLPMLALHPICQSDKIIAIQMLPFVKLLIPLKD